MELEEADIRAFINLWQKEFHECLSLDQGTERATELLELYAVLYGPKQRAPRQGRHPPSTS